MNSPKLQARDLLVLLDRSRPGSLTRQLEEQLRAAIQSGRLAASDQLPSTRAFAQDLGVSRGVVERAYNHLAAAGYITLRQGATTTVRAAVRFEPEATRPSSPATKVFYNLRPQFPEIAKFPREAWLRAMRDSLERATTSDLSYSGPAGLWDVRVEIAKYLSRARGALAHPERIVITTGVTHALSLVCHALARNGRTRMAFENPSHPLLRAVATAGGQTVVAAEVDELGVIPSTIRGADSVFVTPAHQFPTGVALSPARQAALIEWAEETGALIVEDDYDAEFRYDRAPIGALQRLAPERVIYMGSTGKTLIPGLRLGWALLPECQVDDLQEELFLSSLQVSAVDQIAFMTFLRRGDFDRHLRRMRQVYRERRDAAVLLLNEVLPQHAVRGIAAGMHVILQMPSCAVAARVREDAREAGIVVETLDQHAFLGYAGPAGILIGYGGVPEATLEPAIMRLAGIVRAVEASEREAA